MRVTDAVLELLEFRRALYPFRENLRSELGERALDRCAPCGAFDQLEKRRSLLEAWRRCEDDGRGDELPWSSNVVCVSGLFEAARRSGLLSGDELVQVRVLLALAKRMREALQTLSTTYPAFEGPQGRLRDFSPELESLAVLEDSGRLADGASPKLREIREALEGLKRTARASAQRLIDDPSIANMLQERSLAWRDGRFLLLVRQEYINRFPGLAVDRSASGNSVYMEPRSLSSLNNGLMLRTREERDEEFRILKGLTRQILTRERAIVEAEDVLGELDLVFSASEVMRKRRWILPELTRQRRFVLQGARHPLLYDAAVPVDVGCGSSFSTLVVTGPNTGGKTVVLKIVGLCVAMAWSGLPLPVRDGSVVGDFDAIFADIGDEQSIEQNLSTFSAHLRKIIDILRDATRRSIVLLDELGAGTDPHEGAALGIAILDTLRKRKTLTLATTHHNPIKQYALTAPGVETASMEFDVEKLAPTYRLLMGVPGKSNALAIAARYGMPEPILDAARESLRSREVSVEELMGELNERRAALDRAERELEGERAEMKRLKRVYEDRVAELELQKDRIIEAADRRAAMLLSRAEETSREMIRGLEESVKTAARRGLEGTRKEARKMRQSMDARQAKRVEREIRDKQVFEPAVGMTVQVAGSSIVGLIDSIRNGKARLIAGPMNLEVSVDQLISTDKKAKVAHPPTDTTVLQRPESVPSSLAIRGMNVDEAMPLLSRYLDKAYRAGYSSVMIIHGRGEGILRREVHALCSRLKYVRSYRLGEVGEGGYGVTVVSF
ncbi:MAG: endonuclease MutS2 [Fretibacterium sp.]|nr:endonuclease MutS2 [Fretibacterium sp.]